MKLTQISLAIFTLFSGFTYAQMTPTYDDILIQMRDGEFLEADVYIPTGTTTAEVILIQTPYNKDLFQWSLPLGVGMNVDAQPYIWVIVDWRGFYGSSGADLSNFTRGEDGYDICEWITQQSWHADRIGTWGPSALGGVQYNTAQEQHPNHTCAVPVVAHPQQAYNHGYFFGGVLERARLEQLDALGYGLSPVVLANPYYSPTWQFAENNSWYPQDIIIPTLQIGGWYDHNISIMMDWYEATRTSSALAVRDEQWLLVGPWVHGGTGIATVGSSTQGELTYPNAAQVNNTMAWDFFAYYLLDTPNGWENTDLITYYEMGTNTWNSSNATRIDIANQDVLYLNTGNELIGGTGSLNTSFVSDPSSPSPTIGGANLHPTLDQGPYDQISLEARPDIITFATEDLNMDVTISGKVTLDLFVEADQPDCDISVRLVDVYPDGRNMLITDGIKRMRFRNGYTAADEAFMTPGTVYPVEVELATTNYTWLAGHKIKAYIGANSSYRWDVNLQNGSTMYVAGDTNVANITIHLDDTYPSKINLPGNNPTLSIDDISALPMAVFPNPATKELTIESEGVLASFSIVDLSGRMVQSGKLNENVISIEHLKSGVYILEVKHSLGKQSKRFVKL
jgi:predicted acyl esterase